MLFTTKGLGQFIGGVILFDETIRQATDDGRPFVEVLAGEGMLPGIEVDRGARLLAGPLGEQVTEGLDGLRDRLVEYGFARYAALYLEAEIVATVEPEVLMDGEHSLERCLEVTDAAVAEATVRCRRRTVPAAVPGIVFLSGGQADELASARLNARNRLPGPWPWPLSFSYARALQAAPLRTWGGDPARVGDAQRAFYHRARCNGAARSGMYTAKLERSVA